jgi:hypothetical protein
MWRGGRCPGADVEAASAVPAQMCQPRRTSGRCRELVRHPRRRRRCARPAISGGSARVCSLWSGSGAGDRASRVTLCDVVLQLLGISRRDLRARSRCRCGRGEPSPASGSRWGGSNPGADVAGASPVPAADVAGVSPVPVQMWQGEASPGADVAGVSPVPAQMWQLRAQPMSDVAGRARATKSVGDWRSGMGR